jgi:hypothetical protein
MSFANPRRGAVTSICTVFFLAGCADMPKAPDPPIEEGAIIGIRITHNMPMDLFNEAAPHFVYFVRLENGNLLGDEIIRSNYRRDDRLYLLNATPGTYVAIATSKMGPPAVQYGSAIRHTTYFERYLVERTRIDVKPNAIVFMGNFEVKMSQGWAEGDDVQTHYRNIIAPGAPAGGFLKGILQGMSGDVAFWGKMAKGDSGDQAISDFITKAGEDFSGSGWAARLKQPTGR